MPKQSTNLFKKIVRRLLLAAVLVLIVWANVIRFNDNLYANYEKIVDYGRVREVAEVVNPVMAAIFYDDKVTVHKNISTYYNHFDNYKKQNVKIVVVPKKITPDSQLIVKKLYAEIYRYNKVEKIALVADETGDISAHIALLEKVMHIDKIKKIVLNDNDLSAEKTIDEYLNNKHNTVVMLADLSKGFNSDNTDFLLEEAVYFAQKYFYHLEVFDVVDTQIAHAVEKDYFSLLSLTNNKDEPVAMKQKRNLALFTQHYETELLRYFKMNLHSSEDIIWPEKTARNFRMFDRGWLYVRLYDEEFKEIFDRKIINYDKGVIVSLINIARKAAVKIGAKRIKYIRINLLTDIEKINKAKDTMLISYLDQDDGVYVEYKEYKALLIADERPDDPAELTAAVRKKAGIPSEVPDEEINFYKFKSVEINDEN